VCLSHSVLVLSAAAVFHSSPAFRNEYPIVVTEIEKWLRVRYANEDKFNQLHNPTSNAYGKICWFPCESGWSFFVSVTELILYFSSELPKKFEATISKIAFWLAWIPFALVVEIAALAVLVAGALIFAMFYFVPSWLYLFGVKYFLVVLRKISVWLTMLTPFCIFVFLVYSPVCKQIPDATASK